MFTGIIEEVGEVLQLHKGKDSAQLTIKAQKVLEDVSIGDSIAVNGVCLTVTSFQAQSFTADVMHETLNRSSLAQLKSKSHVNLERAMLAGGRFGGHIVAGHVDGIGTIIDIQKDDVAVWYTIQAKEEIMRYIIEKGSIAIDGISLTVARVSENSFAISAIPHTIQHTTLWERQKGDSVNLENDMVGKYIEKLMKPTQMSEPKSKITREFLMQYGF